MVCTACLVARADDPVSGLCEACSNEFLGITVKRNVGGRNPFRCQGCNHDLGAHLFGVGSCGECDCPQFEEVARA